jgi:hypothetical protein
LDEPALHALSRAHRVQEFVDFELEAIASLDSDRADESACRRRRSSRGGAVTDTSVMLLATSKVPCAARRTLREISWVPAPRGRVSLCRLSLGASIAVMCEQQM